MRSLARGVAAALVVGVVLTGAALLVAEALDPIAFVPALAISAGLSVAFFDWLIERGNR